MLLNYVSPSEVADALCVEKGDFINLSSDIIALAYLWKKKEESFDINLVIDSFIEKLSEEGTLIIPTFSFDFSNKGYYDYVNTMCTTGAIGNAVLKRGDFKRTWNPMHSYAVWGKYKDELCAMRNLNSFGEDSPFKFMMDNGAQQVLLGTDYQRGMTFVHYVETKEHVPYRFHKEFTGVYVDEFGKKNELTIEYPARYYEYGSSEKFNRIGAILECKGISKEYDINGVKCHKMILKDCYPIIQDDVINNKCRNLYDFQIDRSEIWK